MRTSPKPPAGAILRPARMRAATRIFLVGLTVSLAACGGSLVSPKEFVGAGGVGTGNYQGSGTPGSTTTNPGGSSTVPNGLPSGVPSSGAGSTSGGGGGVGGGGGTTGGAGSAVAGITAGSCAGFKNGPGITNNTITVATIADISGPIINEFKSAMDGMNAFVAYFNSTSSICGRKLKLLTYDSQLSAQGSSGASKAACQNAFAAAGSFSASDSGGADITAACGQPDIRATAVEQARQQAPTTIMVLPLISRHIFLEPWVWVKQRFGNAVKKSAFVYTNVGAARDTAAGIMSGTRSQLGYNWTQTIGVDVTSVPNWNTYANQLKAAGVTFVQTELAFYTPNLLAAMQQANYHPVVMTDGSLYGTQFNSGQNASIMNGTYTFIQSAPLEWANRIPEVALMNAWLGRTGGAAGNFTAEEAWASGRLFTQVATQLGGKLTRASMLTALRNVHNFTSNGLTSPSDPGAGTTARCGTVLQFQNGRFGLMTPFPYVCGPLA